MKTAMAAIAAVCLAMSATPASSTNLVTNGSFEIDAPTSGCTAGATALSGWTVSAGNIDIDSALCSGIPAADGNIWIDMTGSFANGTGNNVGQITQTLSTVAGTQYDLSFYFGGNSQWQSGTGCFAGYPNDGAVKAMNVSVGSVSQDFSVDTTGQPCNSAGWVLESILFTATSSSTALTFTSLNGSTTASDYGPLLDGVSVVAAPVPEPATLTLMGLGLAGLGISRRRRV